MSNNRVYLEGLEEFKQALRRLPYELTGEASSIVGDAAQGAADAIVRAYPVRTGDLRGKVKVSKNTSGVSTTAVVTNTAKHAWIFEHGTQVRHTKLGANRGSMPPGHVFIPIAARRRRQMYDTLKQLLEKHGLLVSGDA